MKRLGLGTVQFGLDYGISNRDGVTSVAEVRRILSVASRGEIYCLDTAPAYGDSEARLGRELSPYTEFKIVTKTPPGAGAVEATNTLKKSLVRLKRARVYGLLVHHARDLLGYRGQELALALQRMQRDRLVEKIGFSAYEEEEARQAMTVLRSDLVQLPLNVLDQRVYRSGFLADLRKEKVEIHLRSIFLQGLLLMPYQRLPTFFSPIRPTLEKYAAFCNQRGLTAVQGAFAFVKSLDVDVVAIIGVNRADQLEKNLRDWQHSPEDIDFSCFACTGNDFLDPSRWWSK